MIHENRLLKILNIPHISEKTSSLMDKRNTVTLKVTRDATKMEIKLSMYKLFGVTVSGVRTLIIKGKNKRHGKNTGYRSDWKKAYITLKEGHQIDFLSKSSQ